MRSLLIFAVVVVTLVIGSLGRAGKLPTALTRVAVSAKARKAIVAAARTLRGSKSRCSDFDYFPDGGLRNFYCHIKATLDYAALAKLSRLSIFSSGPHSGTALDLASPRSFGHYNAKFVRWLAAAIPGRGSSALRRVLQPVYDKCLRPLARIFFVTYRKLAANPKFVSAEKRRYLALVKRGATGQYYEQFFYFMSPGFYARPHGSTSYFRQHGFDGGVDGNVTKTCVAFWIRRSIDGTARSFFAGLSQLLRTYDARFLRAAKRVKPSGDHRQLMRRR